MGKSRRGRGEGSIFQREDGRWVAVVDLGPSEGKRQRKLLYGRTRREVSEKLKVALRAQQQGGLLVADERQTVEQYLQWWLVEVVASTVRESTQRTYETNVRCHIVPRLGRIPLTKLSPADVQALINAKLADGLSPRSVQYIHAILRRALGQAERWGLVARNVAKLVDPPRVVRQEVVPLMPDEAHRLLDAARRSRLYALYAVAVAVGLRQGEALGLHWQDVDLDSGTLRVRVALQRTKEGLTLTVPKSSRSRRTVGLPAVCVDALRHHRRQQLEERIAAGPRWQEQGLVFTTTIGTPLDPRRHSRHFVALCEEAGLGHRRFHDLRHTCASLLLAQGVHPRIVMEVLGHSQYSLTMNTYSHVMPTLVRDAADRMDEMLRRADSQSDSQTGG